PRGRLPVRATAQLEGVDEVLEHLPLLADLQRHPLELQPEVRVGVGAGHPLGTLEPGGRAGEVVGEVEPEDVALEVRRYPVARGAVVAAEQSVGVGGARRLLVLRPAVPRAHLRACRPPALGHAGEDLAQRLLGVVPRLPAGAGAWWAGWGPGRSRSRCAGTRWPGEPSSPRSSPSGWEAPGGSWSCGQLSRGRICGLAVPRPSAMPVRISRNASSASYRGSQPSS